ncbi:MAG: hypothetical protein K1000chlam2_01837 [Chlamydiae bacterium]|nr:hypothetical protein [Chlamydiota bacterium]
MSFLNIRTICKQSTRLVVDKFTSKLMRELAINGACELANNLRLEKEEEDNLIPFFFSESGHFNFVEGVDILTLR